jgi:hypothetical protein
VLCRSGNNIQVTAIKAERALGREMGDEHRRTLTLTGCVDLGLRFRFVVRLLLRLMRVVAAVKFRDLEPGALHGQLVLPPPRPERLARNSPVTRLQLIFECTFLSVDLALEFLLFV